VTPQSYNRPQPGLSAGPATCPIIQTEMPRTITASHGACKYISVRPWTNMPLPMRTDMLTLATQRRCRRCVCLTASHIHCDCASLNLSPAKRAQESVRIALPCPNPKDQFHRNCYTSVFWYVICCFEGLLNVRTWQQSLRMSVCNKSCTVEIKGSCSTTGSMYQVLQVTVS
jgi:hypothetical protein